MTLGKPHVEVWVYTMPCILCVVAECTCIQPCQRPVSHVIIQCFLLVFVCVSQQVSCALWVLGEYSSSREEVEAALDVIQSSIGPLPLLVLQTGMHRTSQVLFMCLLDSEQHRTAHVILHNPNQGKLFSHCSKLGCEDMGGKECCSCSCSHVVYLCR